MSTKPATRSISCKESTCGEMGGGGVRVASKGGGGGVWNIFCGGVWEGVLPSRDLRGA